MKGSYIDIGRDAVSCIFLIVRSKMLHAGHYILALHAIDITCGNLTGKIWILSEILEVASAERGAVYVCSRAEKDVDTSGSRILSERNTHLVDKCLVPCCGSCHTTWIECTLCVVSNTLRTVSHSDQRKSKAWNLPDIPVLVSGYVVDLFLKGHLLDNFSSAILMFLSNLVLC